MTDTIVTLAIVGGCALFLGLKTIRNLQGRGKGCGCGCAGNCATLTAGCAGPSPMPRKAAKEETEQ